MATLKTTMLRQSALQDNVRSAGLLKFSTGILVFVLISTLTLYLIRDIGFIPEGFPSLFLILPICSLPLYYAFSGFFELASGETITTLPGRWNYYSIPQRRFLVVIITLMSLIVTSIMMLGFVSPYLRLF